MKYQTHLSKFRHILTKVQGTDLQQVLLRAAAKQSEALPNKVHPEVVVFDALKKGILKTTDKLSSNESFELVSDAGSLAILKKELIDDVIEPFKWDETLEVLLDGLDEADVPLMRSVLVNQYNYNRADEAAAAPSGSNVQEYMIPIVRRIFSDFPAKHLVGIQPMQGPVGLAYTLQYTTKDEPNEEEPKNDELVDISGKKLPLEAAVGKKLTLEVISSAVEACSRNLQASWSLETSQDLKSMHGLNLEAEIIQMFSSEITQEITSEIIANLRKIGGEPDIIELTGTEEIRDLKLSCAINRHCNEIARNTRRGAGNFIVVSSTVATLISESKKMPFELYENPSYNHSDPLKEIGKMNGTIRVFSSPYVPTDEILVGYKGKSGATDAGYIYCPYVPLMSSGAVIDPNTFKPMIRFMTRYGTFVPDNGGDYYSNIKIKGLEDKKETTSDVS